MDSCYDESGEDFLYIVRIGTIDEIEAFIHANPHLNINYSNEYGNTAIHYAAANNKDDVLKFLIGKTPLYDVKNKSGNTPLHWAVQTNSLNSVEIFLSKNEGGFLRSFDFLSTNAFGKSIIGDAFELGNPDIIQLILSHPSSEKLETANLIEPSTDPLKIVQQFDINFTFNGHTVVIREVATNATEDLDSHIIPESLNSDFTGIIVWEASICLSNWLVDLAGQFNEKLILELGAGCGLPGIVASIFNVSKIILTDFSPVTLDNLKHNVQVNESNIKSQVDVLKLDWSDYKHFGSEIADVIIASDIIYDKMQPEFVINTISHLLKVGGKFLYTFSDTRAGIDNFIKLFKGFDMKIDYVPEKYRNVPATNLSKDCLQLKFPILFNTDDNAVTSVNVGIDKSKHANLGTNICKNADKTSNFNENLKMLCAIKICNY